ncbi:MAG: SRPBCC domain-containing protein [Culturomica sp.]|jgi:uncharacterized protein YndB with AHSA1/START domain|nr:SRPBCC domain-containing protein [Culturomica sp.]
MRKKIELEYPFSSSVKVLFSRLSTAPGLAEWFADDVRQRDGKFIFIWNGVEHPAELVETKSNQYARFQWDEREEEDEYFEMGIRVEPLTEDVALLITDFSDPEDEADAVGFWDKQIEILHRNLGA